MAIKIGEVAPMGSIRLHFECSEIPEQMVRNVHTDEVWYDKEK